MGVLWCRVCPTIGTRYGRPQCGSIKQDFRQFFDSDYIEMEDALHAAAADEEPQNVQRLNLDDMISASPSPHAAPAMLLRTFVLHHVL